MASIAQKTLPWWAAIGTVALHIVLPFEIRHGTVLFADLPAAALSLLAIFSLAEMVRRSDGRFRGSLFLAGSAALLLFWAYLMRTNQPVFIAPALVVLAWQRRGILALGASAALFLALVLVEQGWHMHLGGQFGDRWAAVATSQSYWTQFHPKLSVYAYLARPFVFAFRKLGAAGLAFVVLAVPAHLYVLLRSRELVLKAIAAAGLSTFLMFNYYVFDIDDGKLVAFVSQYRILQPFYYSSLLALPAAAAAGWQRLRSRSRSRRLRRGVLASAAVVFAFVLVDFFSASYSPRSQVNFSENPYRRVSDVVGGLLASDPSTVVAGTPQALRTIRLFAAAGSGKDNRWRSVPYDQIALGLQARTFDVLVRDRVRERRDLKYFADDDARHVQSSIRAIELSLHGRYSLAYGDERFEVFSLNERAPLAEIGCSGSGSATNGWGSGSVYPSSADVEVRDSTIAYTLGRGRAYVFSSETPRFSAAPLKRESFAIDPRNEYVIRLALEPLDPGQANTSVWLLEYDGYGNRTNTSSVNVRFGNATLHVVPDPRSRYYALAIRVSGNGAVRILSCGIAATRGEPFKEAKPKTGSAREG